MAFSVFCNVACMAWERWRKSWGRGVTARGRRRADCHGKQIPSRGRGRRLHAAGPSPPPPPHPQRSGFPLRDCHVGTCGITGRHRNQASYGCSRCRSLVGINLTGQLDVDTCLRFAHRYTDDFRRG